MKLFTKKYWQVIALLVILTSATIIRFYNFENRINFGPEQAMSLIVSGNYLHQGWSLLGQQYLERTTLEGLTLFTSALFDYSLVPLQIIFQYNPVPITAFFTIINLLTGLLLFFVLKKVSNPIVALFALVLFLFNSTMIYHSMFLWIVNYLPLIGVGILYFLWKFYKSDGGRKILGLNFKIPKSLLFSLSLGLLSGVGIGLEYGFITTFFFILIFISIFSKKKLQDIPVFLIGTIVGTFPIFIFDLKHNFYHLITLFKYLTEGQEIGLVYYHYLHLWPFMAAGGAAILWIIYKQSKAAGVIILLAYIFYNLFLNGLSFNQAKGMSPNFTVLTWQQVASIIAADKPENFNVASLIDFDSRANPLRYYLQFVENKKPLSITQYSDAEEVYVLADTNYNFDQAIAWEVTAFKPFKVNVLRNLNNGYTVYKLTK